MVTGKDSIASVVLSNVAREVVADISETVVVMDPDDVTSMPDVFKAVGVVIVADFEESAATDDSSPLAAQLDVTGAAAGAQRKCSHFWRLGPKREGRWRRGKGERKRKKEIPWLLPPLALGSPQCLHRLTLSGGEKQRPGDLQNMICRVGLQSRRVENGLYLA